MARLFVAAVPPTEVLDRIEAFERPDESGVRYTRREQWHVTLRFIGNADVPDAVRYIRSLAASRCVAHLGPHVRRLGRNVIVLPVAGLDDLAVAVAGATAAVGEPPDPRPFSGHLTLARLKHGGSCGMTGLGFAASFEVAEVHLVESRPGSGGAGYETVSTVQLG